MTGSAPRTTGTGSASWNRLLLVIVAALCSGNVASAARDFSCPTWHGGARLENYSVFNGDPKKLYEITGEHGFDVRRSTSREPDGYHLVCSYKHTGELDLVIPATVSRCEPAGSLPRPAIHCR